MSFQAVTWAIEQKAGGPSAKATLWSIANYANEQWCAWPSQKTICEESEQSPDAVQKRIPELVERGLLRRLPLRYAGRKTVDFFILARSPYFLAALIDVVPLLPRGCSIDPHYAAADRGNVNPTPVPRPSDVPAPDAAAVSGNVTVKVPASTLPRSLPLTLPQVAAHAAALERQQEPVMEPGNQDAGDAGARETPLVKPDAWKLATEIAAIAGYPDPKSWPPGWCGAPMRVQAMLDHGWQPEIMLATARAVVARKFGESPGSINYFEKPFASAHVQQAKPFPTGSQSNAKPSARSGITAAIDRHIERFEREEREQDAGGEVCQVAARLLPNR